MFQSGTHIKHVEGTQRFEFGTKIEMNLSVRQVPFMGIIIMKKIQYPYTYMSSSSFKVKLIAGYIRKSLKDIDEQVDLTKRCLQMIFNNERL